MANKLAGEVEFEAGGKKHVLRLDMNAWISIQAAMGIKDDEEFWNLVMVNLTGRIGRYRTFVFHALKAGEPEGFTEEDAGKLITEYGSEKLLGHITEAVKWALPEPKPKEAGPGKGDKPRPSGGRTS